MDGKPRHITVSVSDPVFNALERMVQKGAPDAKEALRRALALHDFVAKRLEGDDVDV